jgi:hypothetical protein
MNILSPEDTLSCRSSVKVLEFHALTVRTTSVSV